MNINDKANELFSRWDKPNSPGVSAAVMLNGEIIYKNGFGYANLEYDIPITPSTIFHVASVSKQFTTMAILLLEKEGKLSIYDDVHKYIPELPDFGKTITIEHLIHHTSGLRDQWELLTLSGWRDDDVITKEHIMKMIERQKALNFEPGTKFLYSNTGYTLMAEIVERITGKSFTSFTKDKIFIPLDMNNTHFHDNHEMIVKNRAYSYKIDLDEGYKNSILSFSTVGATSLFTTVEDLVKWGHNFNTCKVGGASVINRIQERYRLENGEIIPYAGGVRIGEYNGLKTIEHNGADAGFRSSIVCFPEQKMSIAVLSNLSTFKPEYYAKKLADIFISENKDIAKNYVLKSEGDQIESKGDLNKNYEDLSGVYLVDPGTIVNVEVENDKLIILLPETAKLSLSYISGKTFCVDNTDIKVKWEISENGNVEGLYVVNPNDYMHAKKVNPIKLSTKDLEIYAGDYYSEELYTDYQLVIRNSELIAVHKRHQDSKLIPYSEDSFVSEKHGNWLSGDIKFVKNQGNQIIGFMITSGRVFNLWFYKRNFN